MGFHTWGYHNSWMFFHEKSRKAWTVYDDLEAWETSICSCPKGALPAHGVAHNLCWLDDCPQYREAIRMCVAMRTGCVFAIVRGQGQVVHIKHH